MHALTAAVAATFAAASPPRASTRMQCAPGGWLHGTALSNPESHLRQLENATAESCCAACAAASPRCQSWTFWGHGHCLTFSTIAPAKAEADAISGAAGPVPPPPPPPPRPIPPPAPPGSRNIIMLVSDDMRPELGCYGCTHMRTPHLDSLAKDAVIFDRAYVAVAW